MKEAFFFKLGVFTVFKVSKPEVNNIDLSKINCLAQFLTLVLGRSFAFIHAFIRVYSLNTYFL